MGHFDNGVNFTPRQHATGGVVGAVDHDQLGLRRNRLA